MSNQARGWYKIIGVMLNKPVQWLTGGIVRRLEVDHCDMMYIDWAKTLYTCSGNYTWTATALIPAAENAYHQFIKIGLSLLYPCV